MYEKEILETYTRCNIKTFPIDCLAVIRGIGYTAKTYGDTVKSEEERKILMTGSPDALTYFEKRTIFYNERAHPRRIRFSLMHEVGHIILDTDSEDAADAFAASLLAPLIMVKKSRPFNVDGICQNFDVSVAMANRTIVEAMHYPIFTSGARELFEYFKQFRPKKKETYRPTIRKEIYPDSWNELMLAKHDMDLYFY